MQYLNSIALKSHLRFSSRHRMGVQCDAVELIAKDAAPRHPQVAFGASYDPIVKPETARVCRPTELN